MKRRVTDNHDLPRAHGFGKGKRAKPGRYVMADGELTHVDDVCVGADGEFHLLKGHTRESFAGVATKLRKCDATNQDSVAMGCALSQMDEMNRRFGHLGVKFIPNPKHGHTAVCRYKDRQSRLVYMKATGRHCFEEVRG